MTLKCASLTGLTLAGILAVVSAQAADTIRIGALATLEGPFKVLGQEGMRGVELAIKEVGGKAGGKKIEVRKGSSDTSPESAVAAARRLVEQEGVAILVGPLSGSEGLAIKDYAKTRPQVTFVNGASAAQDTTLRDPSENFFRWNPDGAQFVAGLADYTFNEKGYKTVAVIAEDYSFPYTMVFGFMKEFCSMGGTVAAKFWVPLGTGDYAPVIASLPNGIDALWVGLGGTDAVNFLQQYTRAGGDVPMIGGTLTVDQTVLNAKGRMKAYLTGTPTASPIANTNPTAEFQAFADAYKAAFPDGLATPSLFAQEYYIATKAVLETLSRIDGDLSDGHAKFREIMSGLTLMTPAGKRSLDENRQVITDIFVSEVQTDDDGNLVTALVKTIPQVSQTLGEDREIFLSYGPVGRDNPECR